MLGNLWKLVADLKEHLEIYRETASNFTYLTQGAFELLKFLYKTLRHLQSPLAYDVSYFTIDFNEKSVLVIQLCSRRVVLCLVMVYIRLFVPSLVQLRIFNPFGPHLKYRKRKVR